MQPLALRVAVAAIPQARGHPASEAVPEPEVTPSPPASLDLPAQSCARRRPRRWLVARAEMDLGCRRLDGAAGCGRRHRRPGDAVQVQQPRQVMPAAASGNLNGPACSDGDVASVRSLEVTANVLWGIAGAAAVATGVLFYWEGRRISVSPLAGGTTGIRRSREVLGLKPQSSWSLRLGSAGPCLIVRSGGRVFLRCQQTARRGIAGC